jgi:coproporphyrinogen III oxidase-like Fe-S oxidoreductase
MIGRRESSGIVLKKIFQALQRNFVTSVDIVYGLPGQRIPGLLATLDHLLAAGVHGVSLYRLNISSRNQRFIMRYADQKLDPLYDYVLFQVADQYLTRHAYRKNHFVHYARPEDTNLYYRHVKRQEDLLGLGPTADGVFSAYHYRHPDYEQYLAGHTPGVPVLQGGLWEDGFEQCLHPAITDLMIGTLSRSVFSALNCEPLLDKWLVHALIKPCEAQNLFVLTANGSWLVDEMIAELKHDFRSAH